MKHFEVHERDSMKLLRDMAGGVDLIFTSPPYNIGTGGKRKDGGRKHGKFDAKSYAGITGYVDNLDESIYQSNQVTMLRLAAKALKHDGVLVYNHKPRRKNKKMIHPMVWMSKVHQLTMMEEIIWDRGSTHNHCPQMFWNQTERLYVFRRTDGKYRFKNTNVPKEFRGDVWRIPLSTKPVDGHACPYSEVLADAVMKAFTRPGDVVCDPYSGSGTTGVAALRNDCWYIGSEMDPNYAELSRERLRKKVA